MRAEPEGKTGGGAVKQVQAKQMLRGIRGQARGPVVKHILGKTQAGS